MKRFVEVEQLLRTKGLRLTAQRQLVVRRAVAYLHFTSEELVNLEIDGEPIGALPATFEILPAAVEVKVP